MTTTSLNTRAPAVSVVLPVLNEAQDIERLLLEVLNQDAPAGGFEVIVVDGGSTDGTREIIQGLIHKWPALSLLDNPGRLSSSGRNIGARVARGLYLLYLDGHCCMPRRDYLLRLVALFETTGAACLCRPQPLLLKADGKWAAAIAAARHSWLGHDVFSDIYGGAPGDTNPCSAGAAYVREVINALGGYDECFDACEDVEFNYRVRRAGFRSYRHPDLRIDYRPRASLRSLFRQMARYGRGRAQLMARHPRMLPWPLVGFSPVLLSTAGAIVFATSPSALVIGLIPIAGWLTLVVAESLRKGGLSSAAIRMMPAFLTIHLGLLLGFWRGLVEFPRLAFTRLGGGAWHNSRTS